MIKIPFIPNNNAALVGHNISHALFLIFDPVFREFATRNIDQFDTSNCIAVMSALNDYFLKGKYIISQKLIDEALVESISLIGHDFQGQIEYMRSEAIYCATSILIHLNDERGDRNFGAIMDSILRITDFLRLDKEAEDKRRALILEKLS